MIVCVLIPRLALTTAVGDRSELLRAPLALAPEPGGVQQVGEVSLAAEAFGIHPGMRLGEALSRCPELSLVPPDPAGVADLWERWLVRLESIGARVAPERPGLVCFDARGLLRLHGGLEGVLRAARAALRGPAGGLALRGPAGGGPALRGPAGGTAPRAPGSGLAGARLGVAPTRFVAVAAATRARPRRPEIVGEGVRGYLAPMPVALLRARPALAELPPALERLGVATLGQLAALPADAVADRFGRPGLLARRLACGDDDPLRPRVPGEVLRESLELPEAASGDQLQRGLGLLIDRLLARRERGPRTLRAVVISAALVERGGTWRRAVVFREALADPVRMRLALVPRLAELPAPAQRLGIAVERFGPPAADQRALLQDPAAARASRLREAIRQARAAAGPEAALRVLAVDPDSRVPERRMVLAPFEG